jgi:Zn-dependent protease
MGAAGAVGLFGSIVAHELSHSLVSKRYGMPVESITLFVFGGVAQMEEEPARPKEELLMALAGPVTSAAIGALALAAYALGRRFAFYPSVVAVLQYLWYINFLLAVFNLIPAFPLDGGRVLRAALWKWMHGIRKATRIASWIGAGFAYAIIAVGLVSIFRGALIGGMWWILIGFFLRSSSQMSYRRLIIQEALKGEPVRRFMVEDVITVPASANLSELVDDYLYKHHHRLYPVTTDDELQGCVTAQEVRSIPREDWDTTRVREVMQPCTGENTIAPDVDAVKALNRMNRSGRSRLMVVEGDRLAGILTVKDLMGFISTRLELGGEEDEEDEEDERE